ncbi:DMT family transporter [Paenibacillus septentrionalis]|uniref:DMT family transporter n=1 Tax=Paenibacillus septentrionalis TaxID=429342 RepID=A0ABW1V8Q9_9BACL
MDWISLLAAGFMEMLGVLMMGRYAKTNAVKDMIGMGVSFAASFALLTLAMQTIPMGTAYAVWTGIGASGGALLGMFFFGEEKSPGRIFAIMLVIGATIGLKLVG